MTLRALKDETRAQLSSRELSEISIIVSPVNPNHVGTRTRTRTRIRTPTRTTKTRTRTGATRKRFYLPNVLLLGEFAIKLWLVTCTVAQ